jgi:DNA-binding transcriptional LysR family regulator
MRHPRVDLNVMEMPSQQALQRLDKREIDVGLVRAPILYRTEAQIVDSVAEPMMLMVPADHALASETAVKLESLRDEQFILYDLAAVPNMRSIVCTACEKAGFTPRVAHEAAQIHGLIALVEAGLGIALLPSSVRRAGPERGSFLAISVAGAPIETRIAIAVPGGDLSALTHRFLELASDRPPNG